MLASDGNVASVGKMLVQGRREGMALRGEIASPLLSSPTTSSVPWPPVVENIDFVC